MIQSLIVYSLLLAFMLLFFSVSSKKAGYIKTVSGQTKSLSFWKGSILLPIFAFAILMGMRFDVGKDYLNYIYAYLHHLDIGKGEPLFTGLTKLLYSLNIHYTIYFGIIAFIQAFFFFKAFERERYLFPLLGFFLILNGDFFVWMNVIRQSLAICIWIYSLRFIEQRKFWKYLIWCLIAFGFHTSAIVLVVFYPLLRQGKDYFKSISLQIILFISVLIIQQIFKSLMGYVVILMEFYQSKMGGAYAYDLHDLNQKMGEIHGSGLGFLFRILVSFIIILYSKKLKAFYSSKWFNLIYFFFFFGLLTLYVFPAGAIILTRPFRYFYIFQGIMFAYFTYYLWKSNSSVKKMGAIALVIAIMGMFYLNQITADADSHLWYQFYFQQNRFVMD